MVMLPVGDAEVGSASRWVVPSTGDALQMGVWPLDG